MKTLYPIIIISFFLSCFKAKHEKSFLKNTSKDTLYMPIHYQAENNCFEDIKKFSSKFGIEISNFYFVDQNISVNNDSIAILKPFYIQENFSNCYPLEDNENILMTYNTITKEANILKNILFKNDRNVYQEIFPNKEGFIVYSEQGSSSKLFTSIYISKNKIDSIHMESWGFNQFSKMYRFKNFHIKNFETQFIDSLQHRLNIEKN